MQALEEPLVTRRDIAHGLALALPTSVAIRSAVSMIRPVQGAPVLGVWRDGQALRAFNALSVDAARAMRRKQAEQAARYWARARQLEHGPETARIVRAIESASQRVRAFLDGHLDDDEWTDRLVTYLEARRGTAADAISDERLAKDWLVRSESWMLANTEDFDELASAVRGLADQARLARLDEGDTGTTNGDSTLGAAIARVVHIDPEIAELRTAEGKRIELPRSELQREGLARPGAWVSVINESLPFGGPAWLVSSAVSFDWGLTRRERGANDVRRFADETTWVLGDEDTRRMRSVLRREPTRLSQRPKSK